jgi:hypothetical protein
VLTDEDKAWIATQLEKTISERLDKTLSTQLEKLKEYIDERTHDAETRLLCAFADYNVSADTRFRKLEADTSNIDTSATKRLGELERRLTELDIRVLKLEGGPNLPRA